MSSAKESLRVLAGPMLAYFDKRFQEAYDRIDDRMNELYSRVATEVETMSEMTIVMQRFLDRAGTRLEEAVAGLEDVSDVELAFAMAAVGRLHAGARILHVGAGRRLPATLTALGYDVSTTPAGGPEGGPFDCVLWLSAELDRHTVELLGKSLDDGGELVLSAAGEVAGEELSDWSIVEHRRLAEPPVELVRAVPRT
jgi:hypothetical protein